jgi:hypothetical protein
MPGGKPSGTRCIHLLDDYRCNLFDNSQRPKVCIDYLAETDFCGFDRAEALAILYKLESRDACLA